MATLLVRPDGVGVDEDTGQPLPARPGAGHRFDWAKKKWDDPRPLADIKAAKNAEITAARDAADRGTFTFEGRVFQANERSQDRIAAVALVVAATKDFPPGWPGVWKDIDNGYLPIKNVKAWQDFHAAMVAQGVANFKRSEVRKAAVTAATTAAQVAAITWESS